MSRLTHSYDMELANLPWYRFVRRWILKRKIEKIHKIHGTKC
jgi:hypothetical protein